MLFIKIELYLPLVLRAGMAHNGTSERATCWSITINNPIDSEYKSVQLPAGWVLMGQLEQGAEGTVHFQGMLKTPQVRFSCVKKTFPRAHIEVARNPQALQQYVNKEESRVATVETRTSDIPTVFSYQSIIASQWSEDEWEAFVMDEMKLQGKKYDRGEAVLKYVDRLVSLDICRGRKGAEFIGINPMWRSSWKKFYRAILDRYYKEREAEWDALEKEKDSE